MEYKKDFSISEKDVPSDYISPNTFIYLFRTI